MSMRTFRGRALFVLPPGLTPEGPLRFTMQPLVELRPRTAKSNTNGSLFAPLPQPEGHVPTRWRIVTLRIQLSRLLLISCASGQLLACGPTIRPSFDSPEPAARNAAIVRAASNRDKRATPELIRLLSSDDPATRLLSIAALERINATTHGYNYTDSEQQRNDSIKRWLEHYPPNASSSSRDTLKVPAASSPLK